MTGASSAGIVLLMPDAWRTAETVGGQALVWFGISGGAAVLALTLLYSRYVRRTPQAVRAGGSFALFAGFLLLFALGALAAGLASVEAGR